MRWLKAKVHLNRQILLIFNQLVKHLRANVNIEEHIFFPKPNGTIYTATTIYV